MTVDFLSSSDSLPVESAQRIDRICDHFEATWKRGNKPRTEDFLDASPEPVRSILWRELITLELEYRRRDNDEPTLAEYESRFPDKRSQLHQLFHDVTPALPPRQSSDRSAAGPATDYETAPASTNGDLTVGAVLGDYELLEKVGTGGMGLVYRARQRTANRIVAVKVIRPRAAEDFTPKRYREWLGRFQREAELTAGLEHDDIVPVYEVGDVDGQPFYAMRYIEGQSLAQLVRAGPVSDQRAAAYIERVARAVHFAHQRGVLHRDLKPGNILIDRSDRPYVSDFGLATWVEGDSSLTETGACLGSPPYMSPEQVQDAARVTTASDVYSLGATLYDVLTGRPPFRAARTAETLNQVIHRPPVPPRQLNPSIDRDLETITLKCLSKEAERRYASALDLADDLRRYMEGRPIHARPPGVGERIWRWAKRNPMVAGLSAAVIMLLGTTLALTSLGYWNVSAAWKETAKQRDEARLANRQSLLDQARALRTSSTAGRRWAALDALRRAAAISPGEDLRSEYIRCLDLPDIRMIHGSKSNSTDPGGGDYGVGAGRLSTLKSNRVTNEIGLLNRPPPGPPVFETIEVSPSRRYAVARHRESRRYWLLGMDPNGFERELHDFAGEPIKPHFLAFSPASDLLAVAAEPTSPRDRGQTVLVFRVENSGPSLVGTWEVGEPGVDCLCFSPDGRRLAATTNLPQKQEREFGVRLWDVGTQQELSALSLEPSTGWRSDLSAPGRLSFSDDCRRLAAARNRAAVWDLEQSPPKLMWSRSLEPNAADVVHILDDLRWLVTIDRLGQLKLWDALGTGDLAVTAAPASDVPADAPDLRQFESGSILAGRWNTGPLAATRVWEWVRPMSRTFTPDHSIESNPARPDHFALTFSPDERWLAFACGSSDRDAPYLIDLTTLDAPPIALKEGGALPRMFAFDLRSEQLWSAARRDQTVWHLSDLKPTKLPSAGLVLESAMHGSDRIAARLEPMSRLTVMDVSSGAAIWTTPPSPCRQDRTSAPQFSPDGHELLTVTRGPGSKDSVHYQIRDVRDGTLRLERIGGSGHGFFRQNTPVSVMDVNGLALKDLRADKTFEVVPADVPSPAANYSHFDKLTFSNDGRVCAETGLSGDITIWDLSGPSRIPRAVIKRHRPDSFADQDLRAFTRDGSRIAAFDGPRHLKIWDTQTGDEVGKLELSQFPELFAFAVDERELLLVYLGRKIETWRPAESEPRLRTTLESTDPLEQERGNWWHGQHLRIEHALQLSADRHRLVYVSRPDARHERTIYLWNIMDGSLTTHRLPGNGASTPRIALNPDARLIAVEETWGDVQISNLDSERELARFPSAGWTPADHVFGLGQLQRDVCISDDGAFAAWCENNGALHQVRVCRLADGNTTSVVEMPDRVNDLALSPNGRTLAIAAGNRIDIYDLRYAQLRSQITAPTAETTGFTWNGAGTLLVSSSAAHGNLRLWDTVSGTQLAEFDTGWPGVMKATLSRNARWLAAMNHHGQVRLWDLDQVQARLGEAGLAWKTPEID